MEDREHFLTNSKRAIQNQIMDFILIVTQNYFNIPENFCTKKTRKAEVVFARQVSAYLIRKYTQITLKEIGTVFNQDHSSILHGIRKVQDLMDVDKYIRKQVNDIDKIVQFKSQAFVEEMNIEKDYYYIDLSNFTSLKLIGEKAILLTGFSDEEKAEFLIMVNAIIAEREHKNTGMYIFEKKDKNGEQEK
jgi:hypothetical protein